MTMLALPGSNQNNSLCCRERAKLFAFTDFCPRFWRDIFGIGHIIKIGKQKFCKGTERTQAMKPQGQGKGKSAA